MNDDTVITPQKPDAFTLTFTKDGRFSGTTDCNGFMGDISAGANNSLVFGQMASTLMFCENSQEAQFTNMISNVGSYMINEEGNLILLIQFDSGSIYFVKQ